MRYRKGGTRQKNAHAARRNVCAIVRAVYVLCTFCFLPLVLLVLRNSLICSHACFTLTFCSFTFCFIPRNDSLSAERKEMVIEKIQDMHEYKLQRERANKAEMQAAHHKLVFYRIAVTLGVVILILLLLLHRIRVHKQKLTEELKATQWMRMEETLKRKEAEVALAHEQEKLKQQEIDRLNKSVAYYRQLNAITLPSLLRKRNSQGALHLTEEEWDIIQQNTDTCFDGFTRRLKECYPQLTEEELRFCCLVKMDLPMSLLSEIYHIAKGSISRRKMRLKEKMHIENSSFDEFITAF